MPSKNPACLICGGPMPPESSKQARYCSDACRKERDKRRTAARDWTLNTAARRAKRPAPAEKSCEVCGKAIPPNPGFPAKVCSEACRKARNNEREKFRYQKIKDTPEWLAARADYLVHLRERMQADPEMEAAFRAYARQRSKQSAALRDADPARRAAQLEAKRNRSAEIRSAMEGDPVAYALHRQKAREWYQALSLEDKHRIYYEPRRELALKNLFGIADVLEGKFKHPEKIEPSMKPSAALDRHRIAVREIVRRFNAANPRVFGSVLHETDRAGSDLYLLVDALPGTTLFDLGGLQQDMEVLLGVRVDVLMPSDLPAKTRAQILQEAMPV